MDENMKGIEKLDNSEILDSSPIVEEQNNSDLNYHYLDKRLQKAVEKLPYKDTNQYTSSIDYEDQLNVQYQKRRNKKWEEEINKWKPYCENGCLFVGHVQIYDTDYFITESSDLDSTDFCERNDIYLINSDDRHYSQIVNNWRFPRKDNKVNLARNIDMSNRHVNDVDILLDTRVDEYSEISDKYLRTALLRNKYNPAAQSIIQTIQEKQNDIRELPAKNSFIVQGCAGSGKTMVLLHRLRYQIYNEDIYNSQVLFLVPSYKFKFFIEDLLNKFNIKAKNVMPYTEYYQRVSGVEIDSSEEDISELVFNNNYLARVYSESFMKECYQELFAELNKRLNDLTDYCDWKLNEFIRKDIEDNNKKMDTLTSDTFELIDDAIKEYKTYFNFSEKYTEKSLSEYIRAVKLNLKKLINQILAEKESPKNEIEDNDPIILSDFRLSQLRDEILQEEKIIEKGSLLTVNAHKKKLSFLKEKFSKLKKNVVNDIDQNPRKVMNTKFSEIIEKVSVENIQYTLEVVEELSSEYSKEMSNYKRKKKEYDNNEYKKYNRHIKRLNDVIDATINMEISMEGYCEGLIPGDELLYKNYLIGSELYMKFKEIYSIDNLKHENLTKEEKANLKEANEFINQFKFFNNRSKAYIEIWSHKKLFFICSKKVLEEFQIKICEFYKHYWYLYAYSSYLTKPFDGDKYPFIFIDEAQDLSVSEIELINKINLKLVKEENKEVLQRAVINLFGDVNQTITKHGITDWNDVKNISKVYLLEENFRNTRQIVKYCNSKLSMNMTDIGVDMDDVHEFHTLDNAIARSKNILNNAVFIVKDEYAKQDLNKIITSTRIKNPIIYTVKDVKGLEFQEIYVFKRGMTRNEMYIAYTRALAILNVIFELPEFKKEHVDLIIQGDEVSDDLCLDTDSFHEMESEVIDASETLNSAITDGEEIDEGEILEDISEVNLDNPREVPDDLREDLDRLFEKLDKYYPNKIITDSNKMDIRTLKKLLSISKILSYPNASAFLEAYGYKLVNL